MYLRRLLFFRANYPQSVYQALFTPRMKRSTGMGWGDCLAGEPAGLGSLLGWEACWAGEPAGLGSLLGWEACCAGEAVHWRPQFQEPAFMSCQFCDCRRRNFGVHMFISSDFICCCLKYSCASVKSNILHTSVFLLPCVVESIRFSYLTVSTALSCAVSTVAWTTPYNVRMCSNNIPQLSPYTKEG